MSSPISLRLDEQINEVLENYVLSKGISKAEFIRSAIIEKSENEYDIMMTDKNYVLWEKDGKKVKTLEEMMNLYG